MVLVRKLMNEVLANGAYSDHEEQKQLKRLEAMMLNSKTEEHRKMLREEIELVSDVWKWRREQAIILMEELREHLT